MTDLEYEFPERLQDAMDQTGLSPADFEDCGVCSASSIRAYLEQGRLPNLATAVKIAEFLSVDLSWLCGLVGPSAVIPVRDFDAERRIPWK